MLVIAPSVAGIVLYKVLGDDDLHLVQIKEGEDGLLHTHFTHLTLLNPAFSIRKDIPSGLIGFICVGSR